jgi:hypothetical protein
VTGGLQDQACDAAFVWLPVDDPVIDSDVLAVERRFVASGAAIVLLAEGNAAIYARPGT